jgi:hypothetical protein
LTRTRDFSTTAFGLLEMTIVGKASAPGRRRGFFQNQR